MKEYLAIGLMSGSSLDGIDIALVRFQIQEPCRSYRYNLLIAETLPYPETWQTKLSNAFHSSPSELEILDKEYGAYLGLQIKDFVTRHQVKPDFVASHGHTIFHKPEQHYTLQIGDGQAIANHCGLLTINDFRSEDVQKGGQGAPLVPIGDALLFSDYDICLNIGGIANLSYVLNGKRIAYDICIANQALNYLANKEGQHYDRDGLSARSGNVDSTLLEHLNAHPFYLQEPPKSLGREFFESELHALLDRYPVRDALATVTEHIAIQIAKATSEIPSGKMLITGGGARNKYLIERIQHHANHTVVLPDTNTIDYKEALIFALLGVLRLEGQVNVLSSVTGASSDSSSGRIWHPSCSGKQ